MKRKTDKQLEENDRGESCSRGKDLKRDQGGRWKQSPLALIHWTPYAPK